MSAKPKAPRSTDDLSPEEREIVMTMREPAVVLDDLRRMTALFVQITAPGQCGGPPSEITETEALHWLANRMADRAEWLEKLSGKEAGA